MWKKIVHLSSFGVESGRCISGARGGKAQLKTQSLKAQLSTHKEHGVLYTTSHSITISGSQRRTPSS